MKTNHWIFFFFLKTWTHMLQHTHTHRTVSSGMDGKSNEHVKVATYMRIAQPETEGGEAYKLSMPTPSDVNAEYLSILPADDFRCVHVSSARLILLQSAEQRRMTDMTWQAIISHNLATGRRIVSARFHRTMRLVQYGLWLLLLALTGQSIQCLARSWRK